MGIYRYWLLIRRSSWGVLANSSKTFFPIFLLGAIFGKRMEESGAAAKIADWVVQTVRITRGYAQGNLPSVSHEKGIHLRSVAGNWLAC